ncbi:RNA polymerase sigma factor [Actimicrobium antarcticum]|uniref:RNA polymerase sigma factor HrpL n=1 Tax=Actimicrobium antarcticum TaxID=1051899 RepID=A0ABP7SUI2_9BURK
METLSECPQATDELPPAELTVSRQVINPDMLFRQHYVFLLRFTQRYVRNIDDAMDVVQNTFVETIRCADRYHGGSLPSTWLFGIAQNLARNHVRRSYAAAARHADESLLDDVIDFSNDPAEVVEHQQLADRVSRLLDKLPQRIRETYEVVLEHEASYADAAIMMNIPIGTVRSRISRVKNEIRMSVK